MILQCTDSALDVLYSKLNILANLFFQQSDFTAGLYECGEALTKWLMMLQNK
jgi:hypothetical protein